MQTLLDNLIAVMVAGVVTVALLSTQTRSTHATFEQAASHSVKAKTLVFGRWVEHDVLNLGANFGNNLYRFSEPVVDADSNTTLWTFYSDSTRSNGTRLRSYTRYRLVPTTQVTFDDEETFQLYTVNRDTAAVNYVGDNVALPTSAQWVRNLWSIGTLSFFRIEMLGRFGETPRNADGSLAIDEVDYIRVRFGVVPEYVLKPDNYIRELYWVHTIKVRPYWTPPPPV